MSNQHEPCAYDLCNREERNLCAHLFRLLHEDIDNADGFLGRLLKKLASNLENPPRLLTPIKDSADIVGLLRTVVKPRDARIYTEVAVVRDLLFERKSRTDTGQAAYIDKRRQESQAAYLDGLSATSIMAAKPDLVIAFPDLLLVIEAKFMGRMDVHQWEVTNRLVRLWSDQKFWHDLSLSEKETPAMLLGTNPRPKSLVIVLGPNSLRVSNRYQGERPYLTWTELSEIAKSFAGRGVDRSICALDLACKLLNKEPLDST